jgi:hypothetical protein
MGAIFGVMIWTVIILLTLNDMVEHTLFNYYSWFAVVVGVIIGIVAMVVSIFAQDKEAIRKGGSKVTLETVAIFIAQFPITFYLMWVFDMNVQMGLYVLSATLSWIAVLIFKIKSL